MRPAIKILVAIGLSFSAIAAYAQTAQLPVVNEGDSWVYKQTDRLPNGETREETDTNVISRVGSDGIVLAAKRADSTMPAHETLLGRDWSFARSIQGRMQVLSRPFSFPMKPGDMWKIEYDEDRPNAVIKTRHTEKEYKVAGWENITVAAGTFRALKIESTGIWHIDFQPAPATAGAIARSGEYGNSVTMVNQRPIARDPATGRTYGAWWYVPEVRRPVKILLEEYNSGDGLAGRQVFELQSFNATGTKTE